MSGLLDSIPVFKARLKAVGLGDAQAQQLVASGINTLAKLAYSSASQPGSSDETAFVASMVAALGVALPTDISAGDFAALRRLWHEAYTVCLSSLKAQVEKTDETPPRRLPLPERSSRFNEQQKRLTGVNINSSLEPAYCLIDYIVAMQEDDILKYVDPHKCCSRDQEISGVKKEVFGAIQKNEQGYLRVQASQSSLIADMSTEHRIRVSLQRRSLALDQCNLLAYNDSESYHDYLFDLMLLQPPAGFQEISSDQILTADKAIWARMTSLTRDGICIKPDGTRPLKQALQEAKNHPMVACLLQPRPKTSQGSSARSGKGPKGKGRDSPYGGKGKEGKGKDGIGKGKSKARSSRTPCPAPLIGMKLANPDGKRLCFDYNLAHGVR